MRRPRRAVVVEGSGSDDRLALPVELYTRGEDDELVPVDLGSGGPVVVAWADVTGKPTTFAPAAHTHAAADISSGTLALARVPTGTTASTVALGNHTHAGLLAGSAAAVTDATDEAAAVVQLNALLAVLRTRGVLST